MLDLTGKTALVLGGTSGIGLAAAELFVRQGASVMLSGRTAWKDQAAQDQLQTVGGTVALLAADVCDEAKVKNVVTQTPEVLGGLTAG